MSCLESERKKERLKIGFEWFYDPCFHIPSCFLLHVLEQLALIIPFYNMP